MRSMIAGKYYYDFPCQIKLVLFVVVAMTMLVFTTISTPALASNSNPGVFLKDSTGEPVRKERQHASKIP